MVAMDSLEKRLGLVVRAAEAGTLQWKSVGAQDFAAVPAERGMTMLPFSEEDRRTLDTRLLERRVLREEVAEAQAHSPVLSSATESWLRTQGIAVFENRLIFDAQPPITKEALAAIEHRCAGSVPDELVELWSVCFGGELFYDLSGHFPDVEQPVPVSFRELFYDGSGFYRDLDGWIAHSLELAEDQARERGKPAPDVINPLPFGGFEYNNRAYIELVGEERGAIHYWKQALPPAWNGALKSDSVASIAPSLKALFHQLHVDIEGAPDPYGDVQDILKRLAALTDDEPHRHQEIRAFYLSAKRPG